MNIREFWQKLQRVNVQDEDDPFVNQDVATMIGAGGGGLPAWFQSGSGSPVGTVTPSQQGALYQDTTNGALYEAGGVTDADWRFIGPFFKSTGDGNQEFQITPRFDADTFAQLYLDAEDGSPNTLLTSQNSTTSARVGTHGLGYARLAAFTNSDSHGTDVQAKPAGFFVDFDFTGQPNLVFLRDGSVPDNSMGDNGAWAFAADGHIYFRTGGAWVQKV